jgi:hypothetical protein
MFRALLTVALLLAGVATAADGLVPLRQGLVEATGREESLAREEAHVRDDLKKLAGEISMLKGKQAGGSTLAPLLRRSQELSDRAESLAVEHEHARAEKEAAANRVSEALTHALDETRARFLAARTSEERRRALEALRLLKAERERVWQLIPQAAPALSSPYGTYQDPDDLLAQADALRDAQDKALAQLKLVEARVREAREEEKLAKRLSSFEANEALMDEEARDLRVTRTAAGVNVTGPSAGTSTSSQLPATAIAPSSGPMGAAAPSGGGTSGGTLGASSNPNPSPASAAAPRTGEDVRNQTDAHLPSLTGPLPDDLPSLLERAKKLKAMAEDLGVRAQGAEERARAH